MGKIISIAIQKGGCGKTSTTLCLGSSLKEMGYKVLMVDLDPQGNLTYGSGVENVEKTIYNLFNPIHLSLRPVPLQFQLHQERLIDISADNVHRVKCD